MPRRVFESKRVVFTNSGARIAVIASPGSILALTSHVFEHEVMPYEGNLISFAWFVKDTLYQWAHMPETPWAQEADILDRL